MMQNVDIVRATQAIQNRSSISSQSQGNPFFEVFANMTQALAIDGEDLNLKEEPSEEAILIAALMQATGTVQNIELSEDTTEVANLLFEEQIPLIANTSQQQLLLNTNNANVEQVITAANSEQAVQSQLPQVVQIPNVTNSNRVKFSFTDYSADKPQGVESNYSILNNNSVLAQRVDTSVQNGDEFIQIQKAMADTEQGDELMQANVGQQLVTEQTLDTNFDIVQKKAEIVAKQPEFVNQMKFGINETMEKGEFVMKLYPEELGEVTIKLINEGSKQVLEIVTATAQATKLINDDLAVLREAFRPLQIEVRESITTVEQSLGSQMSDLGAFDGRQNRQNFTAQQSQDDIYYPLEDDETQEDANMPENNLDMLSIYI